MRSKIYGGTRKPIKEPLYQLPGFGITAITPPFTGSESAERKREYFMHQNIIKTCAYCGSRGPFSREHVIPAFLYRQYPDQKFGLHPKASRYIEWEAVVGDVCSACNSGSLSSLDAYAKAFTERNRCHRTSPTMRCGQLTAIHDDFQQCPIHPRDEPATVSC